MGTTANAIDLDACGVVSLRVTNAHRMTHRFQDGLVAQLNFDAAMTPTTAHSPPS